MLAMSSNERPPKGANRMSQLQTQTQARPEANSFELRCRFCGCTEDRPCIYERVTGPETCSWVIACGHVVSDLSIPPDVSDPESWPEIGSVPVLDPTDNLCSNPECIKKAYHEAAAKCHA